MENTWLNKFLKIFTGSKETPIQGQQRPLSAWRGDDFSALARNYDLEISEVPIRNPQKARQLIEAYEFCPEIATAIDEIRDSIWSSADGDDQGFAIADTLDDNVTPVDPEVKIILQRLIDECIGSTVLEPSAERILAYGDAFASIGIDWSEMRIKKILFLPTWEIFRVEDNQGNLVCFQQRKSVSDEKNSILFHPLTVVHWRYRRQTLYGKALFYEIVDDWNKLKLIGEYIARAARDIGINPNLHIMPGCADENYKKRYKEAYENVKRDGPITDLYLSGGADIKKLSTLNPDIKAILDAADFRINRIIRRSRVPPWLMGYSNMGAREISHAPERAYARFINRRRMDISAGIRHLCNLELGLQGIRKERWKYRIIWPKFYIAPFLEETDPQADETNREGIADLNE